MVNALRQSFQETVATCSGRRLISLTQTGVFFRSSNTVPTLPEVCCRSRPSSNLLNLVEVCCQSSNDVLTQAEVSINQ